MSSWFKAVRISGERGGIGEFHVEDANGVEWHVRSEVKPVDRRITEHDTVRWLHPVCYNASYKCSFEMSWDLTEACKELVAKEAETNQEATN